MQLPPLRKRVERLENQVDQLVDLPARMDAFEARLGACEVQILQLRGEMRAEFVAVRGQIASFETRQSSLEAKMNEGLATLEAKMDKGHASLEAKINQSHASLEVRINDVQASLDARIKESYASLESKIAEGDAETRAFMRILHEDLVQRIAVIGEQRQ